VTRVGIGYDSHRFVEGRPLILGGVTIPHSRGLAGHSDADAVAHALTDAILGAAAAGNIGQLFPDTDPQWKDADSMELLRTAHELVRGRGLRLVQADLTILTELPRLQPHMAPMAASLAARLALPTGAINVKTKTNEGMGFIGRGEGLAVMAVALLEAR
jgi:2-C-methyl-D-erythritol 2,4-cyclodiphosphate synthase